MCTYTITSYNDVLTILIKLQWGRDALIVCTSHILVQSFFFLHLLERALCVWEWGV